jgi:acyl-coenzyme A thioesterase PaaI-like protein
VAETATPGGLSLQERYDPHGVCYGCGPANPRGLHIRSFPTEGDEVVAQWHAQAHHHAFDAVLNGGVIGTLFDCHCNWTAAHHLMKRLAADAPPPTVTANFSVRLLKPTPMAGPVTLRAHVVESTDDRATVEGTLEAGGAVTATCRAMFVAVRPGHPGYNRW